MVPMANGTALRAGSARDVAGVQSALALSLQGEPGPRPAQFQLCSDVALHGRSSGELKNFETYLYLQLIIFNIY